MEVIALTAIAKQDINVFHKKIMMGNGYVKRAVQEALFGILQIITTVVLPAKPLMISTPI
jgi:hypothetical protein